MGENPTMRLSIPLRFLSSTSIPRIGRSVELLFTIWKPEDSELWERNGAVFFFAAVF